ncbi:PAS domain S-box protein [candidate division KSB1 bacterium]|nr:PAS domain S-box protein [candidate division KSB1 bacterium]
MAIIIGGAVLVLWINAKRTKDMEHTNHLETETKLKGEIESSEKQYRELVERANDGVWMLDKNHVTLFANRRMSEITGYDELVGRPAFLFFNEESQKKIAEENKKRLRGESSRYEVGITTRDGKQIPVMISGSPRFDDKGNFLGTFGIVTDISERKKIEEELKRINEELKKGEAATLNVLSDIHETNQQLREATRQLEAFSRISSEIIQEREPAKICAITAQAIQEYSNYGRVSISLLEEDGSARHITQAGYTEEEKGRLKQKLALIKRLGQGLFENKSYRVGGCCFLPRGKKEAIKGERGWHPDDLLLIPLTGREGVMIGFILVDDPKNGRLPAVDTLRPLVLFANQAAMAIEDARLDREIRETRDYLENLVDSSVDAILTTDRKGRITFASRGASAIFGYDPEEALGRPVAEFYDKGIEEAVKIDHILRRKGKIKDYEIEIVSKDGRHVPCSLSAAILRNGGGRPIGTVGVIKDFTERKMLERELLHAEKLASLGRLTAGVMHEILNPLNIISGNVQLLQRKKDFDITPRIKKALDIIEAQVGRIVKITDGLLRFSRQKIPGRKPIHIGQLIEKTLSLVEHETRLENITIVKQFDPHTPIIQGDTDQLSQVVMNLINNARDAMPEGGTMTITTKGVEDERGSWVQVEFMDTGVGIAPENLSKIFDPFYTSKEVGKGTGLGLSVSLGIIEGHGGTISVQSKVGKGTTFSVKLPVMREES